MSAENPIHTYLVERTYREGWGVNITPVFAGEDDDRIADIDVEVIRIHPESCRWLGGAYCAMIGENYGVPVENFREVEDLWEDDTHDLRARWFPTEEAAKAHAKAVADRWANPQPWESFVKLN